MTRRIPLLVRVTCLTCNASIPVEVEDPSEVGSAGFRWRMKHFNKFHAGQSAWQFRADPIPSLHPNER